MSGLSNSKCKPELCNGCYAANPDEVEIICSLQPEYNNHICPCSTCLIKGVCDSTDEECEIFFKWRKLVIPNISKSI